MPASTKEGLAMWMRKYMRAFGVGLQSAMEYRADFLIGMLSAAFPILIQVFMWAAIYGGSGNTMMFNRSFAQMITYSVMAAIISRLVRTSFEYEVNDDIKNGGLSKYVIRPMGYLPYRMSCYLGQKAGQFVAAIGLLAAALLVLSGVFHRSVVTLGGVLAFIPALMLAFVLNFMIFFCVGMWAFWLSEIGFLFEAVRIVFVVLSGGIFPLDIFGASVQRLLTFLPFGYTVNFPVDVLTGVVYGADMLCGFAVQSVWILLLSGLSALLWKIGSGKYLAAGG